MGISWLKDNIIIIVLILLLIVVIVAFIVVIVKYSKKNKEGFSHDSGGFNIKEEFVGTNEYADQFKYAESYINSVMGM